jgi:hypothetical protein
VLVGFKCSLFRRGEATRKGERAMVLEKASRISEVHQQRRGEWKLKVGQEMPRSGTA